MGKVRTGLIKRTARKLLSSHPDLFSEDFQQNKELVKKLIVVNSKKLRNQIAGYITHLIKIQKTRTGEEGQEEA